MHRRNDNTSLLFDKQVNAQKVRNFRGSCKLFGFLQALRVHASSSDASCMEELETCLLRATIAIVNSIRSQLSPKDFRFDRLLILSQ